MMLQPLWCVCVAVLLRSAFSLPSLPRSAWTATTRTLTNPYTKTTPIRPSTRLRDSDILPAGENTTDLALGFAQLEPFLKIAVPFFKEDKTARNSLLGVTGLTLLNSGISVAFSYISRDFYNALNARDEPLFYEKIELFFGFLILAVPVSVYYRFLREKLSIYWREALTATVLRKYYSNRTYYKIETMRDVDNPDQRISEDIRRFTSTSLDFFISLFTALIDLFSFSAILFQIYPGLFAAIIAYAGVGSLITTNLGRSLVGLNYERLQREANFRFSLLRTRENAEAIAFYDDKATAEREVVWDLFKKALDTQLGIATASRNLEYFTTSYRYIVQILPSLIVAPLYFAHKVELGAVSQSYGAFNHILGDFSLIINQFEALSSFSAGLTRLNTFIERLDGQGWEPIGSAGAMGAGSDVNNNANNANAKGDSGNTLITGESGESEGAQGGTGKGETGTTAPKPLIEMRLARADTDTNTNDDSWVLRCEDLTVLTPDGTRVVIGVTAAQRGIDAAFFAGESVLIVGPSGAGKSSFVRAIAGLWQVGSGCVSWNGRYFAPGSQEGQTVSQEGQDGQGSQEGRGSQEGGSQDSVTSAPQEVFFLPQKPYHVLGSLRTQIMYPSRPASGDTGGEGVEGVEGEGVRGRGKGGQPIGHTDTDTDTDEYFLDLLRRANLPDLAARMGGGDPHRGLGEVKDWSKVLSLGEQQRLAFSRILYNKPSVIVLDEATSALDLSSEAAMYALLKDMGATYLSVGHRPSLLRYHGKKFVLRAGLDPVTVKIEAEAEALLDLAAIE